MPSHWYYGGSQQVARDYGGPIKGYVKPKKELSGSIMNKSNDCYASTCHRMFFANLSRGLPPEKCPDNDNHNVDTIDGLIMGVPVVLATCGRPTVEAKRDV